jgi:putative ABC transport system substrate-binding protein
MIGRRAFSRSLAIGIAAVACPALAQEASKAARLGYLSDRPGPTEFEHAFLYGLRELGYIEGRNVVIEYRWAAGDADRLPALAADLVQRKVDVIVTSGIPPARAAKAATATIPIVMATSGDAVSDGLVASFARPGANVTGLSLYTAELSRKRIEVFKEAIQSLQRVGAVFNARNPATPPQFRETALAAEALGVKALPFEISFPDGIEPAFAEAARQNVQGIVIISDAATIANRERLGAAGRASRLPTIFSNKAYLQGGGLMSYGPDILWSFQRAAYYVDRILHGTKPAELPVEQPTRIELALNLKTAHAIGIEMPRALLLRADEVIE